MNLDKKNLSGFTIVELLIVITVIGILAALVLNTLSSLQAKARDTERQTDLSSFAKQLEVFYATQGYYPESSRITGASASTWITANMPGTDIGSITPPGRTVPTVAANKNPDQNTYGYRSYAGSVASDTLCVIATEADCQSFELYWVKESDPAKPVQTIKSLNHTP